MSLFETVDNIFFNIGKTLYYNKQIDIKKRLRKLLKNVELAEEKEKIKLSALNSIDFLKLELEQEIKHKKEQMLIHRKDIYTYVRNELIETKQIYPFKSIELDIFKQQKNIFNLFGLFGLMKISNYNVTPIFYYDKNNNLLPLLVDKKIEQTLDLFNKEKYIVNEEPKPLLYRGKRILHLTPDFPMTMQIDLNKKTLLCDSSTFHSLFQNVISFKLTLPVSSGMDIGGFLKKYGLIILFLIVVYVLYQSGTLNGILGIKPNP